jgi:hypothetical protein
MRPPTPTPNASAPVASAEGARRELALRESDGITVQLLWEPDLDALTLTVEDGRAGIRFELPVARDRGLEAFYHPFAYAAERDDFRAAIRDALDLQPQT